MFLAVTKANPCHYSNAVVCTHTTDWQAIITILMMISSLPLKVSWAFNCPSDNFLGVWVINPSGRIKKRTSRQEKVPREIYSLFHQLFLIYSFLNYFDQENLFVVSETFQDWILFICIKIVSVSILFELHFKSQRRKRNTNVNFWNVNILRQKAFISEPRIFSPFFFA